VIAVSAWAQLGVDIEKLRCVSDAGEMAQFYLAPAEQASLATLPPDHVSKAFLTCWTRKEAFVKALGGGQSIDLKGFEVSIATEHPAVLRSDVERAVASRWTLMHLEPACGYVGALAIDGPVHGTCTRQLDLRAGMPS